MSTADIGTFIGPSEKSLPSWLQLDYASTLAQFEKGTLTHALLFSGQQGIGKRILLKQLGAAMLCMNGQSNSCGACQSCRLIAADTHPDISVLTAAEGKQVIAVDQVRDLLDWAYKTPQIAANKVILVMPADAMNRNAANALLKCLEEPPPHTYFLLASESLGRLPATVRSRCQIRRIANPDSETALGWLLAQGLENNEAQRKLALSPARPLAAFHRGEQQLTMDAALQTAILRRSSDRSSITQAAKSIQGYDLVSLCSAYLSLVLELTKVRMGQQSPALNAELAGLVEASDWPVNPLLAHAASVQKTLRTLLAGSYLNEQLVTEGLLAELDTCMGH